MDRKAKQGTAAAAINKLPSARIRKYMAAGLMEGQVGLLAVTWLFLY
jgi:hypothetical protein